MTRAFFDASESVGLKKIQRIPLKSTPKSEFGAPVLPPTEPPRNTKLRWMRVARSTRRKTVEEGDSPRLLRPSFRIQRSQTAISRMHSGPAVLIFHQACTRSYPSVSGNPSTRHSKSIPGSIRVRRPCERSLTPDSRTQSVPTPNDFAGTSGTEGINTDCSGHPLRVFLAMPRTFHSSDN